MDGNTFKQKVAEGFIVGMMVSLTLAVTGIAWKGFSSATARLESTERLLLEQKKFNAVLLDKLSQEAGLDKPVLGKSFGKFTDPVRFDPNNIRSPSYRVLGSNFKNVVEQRAPIQ